MSVNGSKLMRRELFKTGIAFGALAALSSHAADDSAGHEHHDHHHHVNPYDNLLALSNHCAEAGESCESHCLILVKSGDTSIAECMQAVAEMVPVCRTFSTLLNYQSRFLKSYAKVCLDICTHCQNECEKHAKKHKECKACANACSELTKGIKAFLA